MIDQHHKPDTAPCTHFHSHEMELAHSSHVATDLEGYTIPATEKFPAHEESLLLQLAQAAQRGGLATHVEQDLASLSATEDTLGIADIRARIGSAYPQLNLEQQAAVIAAYAKVAPTLPTSHPRYAHSHEHADGSSCGKAHGPVRRFFNAVEQRALGSIGNKRLRAMAAVAFRAWAFALCPGDDLVAAAGPVISSFSGHTGQDTHQHHDPPAILPRRPRIDFANSSAYIPLDGLLRHSDLPPTPEGALLREHLTDPPPIVKPPLISETGPIRSPERQPKRRLRAALVGSLAVLLSGSILATGIRRSEPAILPVQPAVAEQQAIGTDPEPQPVTPILTETVIVRAGDSQWQLAHDRLPATNQHRTAITNVLTLLMARQNAATNPRPDHIVPGQIVEVPAYHTIKMIATAVTAPHAVPPTLAADVALLNNQHHYGGSAESAAIHRVWQQIGGR